MNENVILTLSKAEVDELLAWASSHYDVSVMSTFGNELEERLWSYRRALSKPIVNDDI